MSAQPKSSTTPIKGRGRLGGSFFWLVIVGLVIVNGWLAWSGRQPEALPAIARMVSRGDRNAAETALQLRLNQSPHDGASLLLLARSQKESQRELVAARTLEAVPRWWPESDFARLEAGNLRAVAGDLEGAEAVWKSLVWFEPGPRPSDEAYSRACQLLARLCRMQLRDAEAREALWRLHDEVDPAQRRSVLLLITEIELGPGPLRPIREALEKAIASHPNQPRLKAALSEVTQRENDPTSRGTGDLAEVIEAVRVDSSTSPEAAERLADRIVELGDKRLAEAWRKVARGEVSGPLPREAR